MKTFLILVCSYFFLTSCGNASRPNSTATDTDTTAIDIHNAENSLDYQGTYKGVLPAADCPGIETTLTLTKSKIFTLHSKYLERNAAFEEKGTYAVDDNILTLKADNGEFSYYKIEENRLRMLTLEKKEVTGDLAEYYLLNKVQ